MNGDARNGKNNLKSKSIAARIIATGGFQE
jgi:hypothetical protein